MRTCMLVCMSLLMLFAFCSCGSERLHGDMDGMPVKFHVLLDRAFVNDTENRQGKLGSSVGHTIGSGGNSYSSVGFGVSFQSTTVTLYGGDGPGQANLFRKKLKWGINDFEVPLRVARKFTMTVIVGGARDGWESIGVHTVDEQQRFYITLGERGAEFHDQRAPSAILEAPSAMTQAPSAIIEAPSAIIQE